MPKGEEDQGEEEEGEEEHKTQDTLLNNVLSICGREGGSGERAFALPSLLFLLLFHL